MIEVLNLGGGVHDRSRFDTAAPKAASLAEKINLFINDNRAALEETPALKSRESCEAHATYMTYMTQLYILDGGVNPFLVAAFLRNGMMKIIPVENKWMDSVKTKNNLQEALRTFFLGFECTGFVLTCEAWGAMQSKDSTDTRPPSEREDRREIVCTNVVSHWRMATGIHEIVRNADGMVIDFAKDGLAPQADADNWLHGLEKEFEPDEAREERKKHGRFSDILPPTGFSDGLTPELRERARDIALKTLRPIDAAFAREVTH